MKVVPGEVQQRADLSCPAAPFLLSDAPEEAARLPSQRTQNYGIAEQGLLRFLRAGLCLKAQLSVLLCCLCGCLYHTCT